MKLISVILICLALIGDAHSQSIPFPGPGGRTLGGGGGFTNLKSITSVVSSKATRTQGTGSSRRKMTFNFWAYNRSSTGAYISYANTSSNDAISFASGSTSLYLNGGGDGYCVDSTAFSDATWYQVTIQLDTTDATASNRCKIFINGDNTNNSILVAFTLNYDTGWGSNGINETIIENADGGTTPAMLIDEFSKIDNQILGQSSFGNGSFKPIDISALAFGSQGYWIRFETGIASTVGDDSSGNNLNFTNSGFVNGNFSSTVP